LSSHCYFIFSAVIGQASPRELCPKVGDGCHQAAI
jgi:hypothetical protein